MNKKAVVFTFIAIALLSVILIAFLINVANKNTQVKIQDTIVRIETLNSLAKSLENELISEALRSSSNRVILSWLYYLDHANNDTLNPEFLDTNKVSLNDNLKNALIKESYYKGLNNKLQLSYMHDDKDKSNYTLPAVLSELSNLANSSGVIFSYDDPAAYTFAITQTSPWEINIAMTISHYEVSDAKKTIFWVFNNKQFSAKLNIENYVEPFMLVYNNRSVAINKTKTADFSNLNVFKNFYQRPEFISHDVADAPSFLSRMQGKFDPSINGIETVLDPLYYPNPNKYSNVDFQYWNRISGCLVDEPEFEDLYLTTGHHTLYSRIPDPSCIIS